MSLVARILIASVTAVFAYASSAYADITANFNGVTPGQGVNWSNSNPGGGSGSTTAGVFNWTRAGGTDSPTQAPFAPNVGSQFKTFCVEITQYIQGNPNTFTIVDIDKVPLPGNGQGNGTGNGMGSFRAEILQRLFESSYASIGSDSTKAAAFQAAVWEIVNEGTPSTTQAALQSSLNVNSGTFTISGNAAVQTQANTFLSNALNWSGLKTYQLYGLSSSVGQDQVAFSTYQGPPTQLGELPEPGTMMLAMTGLAPMFLMLRNKRRLAASQTATA